MELFPTWCLRQYELGRCFGLFMDYGTESKNKNQKSKSKWKWNVDCHDMGTWIQLDDRRRTTHGMMNDETNEKELKRILVDMSLGLGLGLEFFIKVICFLLHYARNEYDNFLMNIGISLCMLLNVFLFVQLMIPRRIGRVDVDAMIRHIGWVQGVPSELRLEFSDMCVFTRFLGDAR